MQISTTAEKHPVDPDISSLSDVPFVDLYMRVDQSAPARYNAKKATGVAQGNHPVPEFLEPELERLRQAVAQDAASEFSLAFNGMRLRASTRKVNGGETWASLRRVDPGFLDLKRLKMPVPLVRHLATQGKRAGLLLLVGAMGSGKSTTAAALLKEYLTRYGGVACTLEDPVEYDMQGPVGATGYCFQSQVNRSEDWAAGVKDSLRWNPSYLLVGEIRTPAAAAQLLRASTAGPLVITTVHGGSIEHGLAGLLQTASSEMGRQATSLLAESLVGVMHQELTVSGPRLKFLFTDHKESGDAIGSCIRDDQLRMLGTYVDQQRIRLLGS